MYTWRPDSHQILIKFWKEAFQLPLNEPSLDSSNKNKGNETESSLQIRVCANDIMRMCVIRPSKYHLNGSEASRRCWYFYPLSFESLLFSDSVTESNLQICSNESTATSFVLLTLSRANHHQLTAGAVHWGTEDYAQTRVALGRRVLTRVTESSREHAAAAVAAVAQVQSSANNEVNKQAK